MSPEMLDDLRPPPLPAQMYGWGRITRILFEHSTAAVELIAAGASMARGLASLVHDPHHWWVALGLVAVGVFQAWAVAQRRSRLRAWAALLTLVMTGAAVTVEFLTWNGYAGAVFAQFWVLLRSGRLFKLTNGHAPTGTR